MSAPARLIAVANEARFFALHRLPLALAARDAGYEVHVATAEGDGTEQILASGLPHWPIAFDRSRTNPVGEVATTRELIRLYRALRPALVHHVTTKAVLHGSLAARTVGGIGVVNTFAGLGHLFTDRGMKSAIVRSAVGLAYRPLLAGRRTHTTFENASDRELFLRRGWVGASRSSVVWGGGIDTERFRAAEAVPPGDPVVILAARLLFPKGVGVFVDAARILRRRGMKVRMALVGVPDPGNPLSVTSGDLESWVEEGVVEWWGQRNDMEAVFLEASIVTLPTFYGEGVPRVLMEAAACELPIITTDIPGCRDLVQDGVSGLLVRPHDPEGVADAIETLLSQPELGRRFGTQARARAIDEFSLPTVAAAFLDLYARLIGGAIDPE